MGWIVWICDRAWEQCEVLVDWREETIGPLYKRISG